MTETSNETHATKLPVQSFCADVDATGGLEIYTVCHFVAEVVNNCFYSPIRPLTVDRGISRLLAKNGIVLHYHAQIQLFRTILSPVFVKAD